MVILEVRRHFSDVRSEHDSVSEAAMTAVDEFDRGMSWPLRILLEDIVIWECGCNPFEDVIGELKKMSWDTGWS